jgi:hypothetical protein
MKRYGLVGLNILWLACLGGCTSQQLANGAYEAGYQHECIQHTGALDCDPNHPGYEDYRQARDTEVK